MLETNLNENIGYLLNSTTNALNTFMQRAISADGIDVPLEQVKMLMFICFHDGVNQQQICEQMQKVKPGVSRLVDGLVKKGLVKRIEDKTDRRNKKLHATNKGIEIRNKFYPMAIKRFKYLEQDLGELESQQLKKHLRGIKKIILDRLNTK